MFGERNLFRKTETLHGTFLAAASVLGLAMPEVAFAETKEPDPIGTVERMGDAALSTHVEGQEAIQHRAQECKAAYDAAIALKKDANMKDAVWIVIDTAVGGSSAQDHIAQAKDGINALKECFAGSGDHPRIVQLINKNSSESGVTMQPIDGSRLEQLLAEAEGPAAEGAQAISRSLSLDLEQDDPTFKDIARVAQATHPREALGSVDSVTLGYSAQRSTDGGYIWEYNGQIGLLRGDDSGVVARGSAGVETVLSPIEGGRTTVGVAAELSRSNGDLDAAFGSYLVTSLGNGRPELVLSTTISPNDGHITLNNQMALRFTLASFHTGT